MEPSRMGSSFSIFMKRNAAEIFQNLSNYEMIAFHVYLRVVIDSYEDCMCLLV